MQKCPYCGYTTTGIFCSRCGRRLEPDRTSANQGSETKTLINRDASRYLFIEASSFDTGFIHAGSISESWYIYSDGSYQLNAAIRLADHSEKEITKTGKMSEDEFRELCDLIDRTYWTDSSACVDGGTLYTINIYDTDGNRIHYGDSITIETLEEIFKSLLPLGRDVFSELMNAYFQSEKEATGTAEKLMHLNGTQFLVLLAGISILALVIAVLLM